MINHRTIPFRNFSLFIHVRPLIFTTMLNVALLGVVNGQELLSFSEVVEVNGASKKELFDRAVFWFAENYKSSKDVIQFQDLERGELLGKAVFNHSSNGYVSYSIKVSVKEGRYKCDIYDFVHHCYSSYTCVIEYGPLSTETEFPRMPVTIVKKQYNKEWASIKLNAEMHAKTLLLLLKDSMAQQVKDW